jgi:polysaccharide export outer membrane protein
MPVKSIFKTLFSIIIIIGLFSCTPQKRLRYLQDKNSSKDSIVQNRVINAYKVRPKDNLYIRVLSVDEKTYGFFNGESSTAIAYDQTAYLTSYDINDSGYITIPVIGKVQVSGLTVYQIKDTLQKSVDQYLKDATVIVKLTNFKITVLGEVNHPGTFRVYDNSINVLEAIGLAGDLNTYGNRQKIMIIRQNENNKVYFIDITDRKIIYSSGFYLLPNDIIYVDALKAKAYGFNVFPFATLLSGITTLILLFNYLKL